MSPPTAGPNARATEAERRVGAVIAEKYRLLRVLGAGGMGAVYEAQHLQTEGRVAIKLVHERDADRDEHARLLAEARVLAKLAHPNVVRLFDVDEDDGALYLVQELLDGVTLRRHLDEHLLLAPREVLELLLPLCDALEAAHQIGVVHRDLKPENIVLCRDARGALSPRLVDFGIALAPSTARTTSAGAAVGTPAYMSPEQARGQREIDARSDVWSLGVIAYECLAGRAPYEGDNERAVLAAIVTEDPPPLGHAAHNVPEDLSHAVMGALCRDRASRIATVAALRTALLDVESLATEPWFLALRERYGHAEASTPASGSVDRRQPAGADAPAAPVNEATPLVAVRTAAPTADAARPHVAATKRPVALLLAGAVALVLVVVLGARARAPAIDARSTAPASLRAAVPATASIAPSPGESAPTAAAPARTASAAPAPSATASAPRARASAPAIGSETPRRAPRESAAPPRRNDVPSRETQRGYNRAPIVEDL